MAKATEHPTSSKSLKAKKTTRRAAKPAKSTTPFNREYVIAAKPKPTAAKVALTKIGRALEGFEQSVEVGDEAGR